MKSSLQSIYHQIADLGRTYGAEKVLLYGSRARGDYHERSDIDIAVYGLPELRRGDFWEAVEELPTLLKFDIAFVIPGMDAAFLQNIEKDGIALYEKS